MSDGNSFLVFCFSFLHGFFFDSFSFFNYPHSSTGIYISRSYIIQWFMISLIVIIFNKSLNLNYLFNRQLSVIFNWRWGESKTAVSVSLWIPSNYGVSWRMPTISSFYLVLFGCVYFSLFFIQDGTNMAQDRLVGL